MLVKDNGIEYWIENGEAAVFKVSISKDTILIPEKIQDVAITKIAPFVFANTNVKEVLLPSTIYLIGQSAFADCHDLTTINFYTSKVNNQNKKLITVADKAFWNCSSLKEIHLSDKPVIVRQQALAHCTNLMELNGKIKDVYGYGFDGCESLTYLVFANDARLRDNAMMNVQCMSGLTFTGSAIISKQTLKYMQNEGIRIACYSNSNLVNLAYEGYDVSILKQ